MTSIATPSRDEGGMQYGGCECGSEEEVYVHEGRRVCQTCQEHPDWHGGTEWAYLDWLAERGLDIDGWMNGWQPDPSVD